MVGPEFRWRHIRLGRVGCLDPADQMATLLEWETEGRLPDLLLFWGSKPRDSRPVGPWVLSQWWPTRFVVDGVAYRHSEGFMMAAKARLFGDDAALEKILAAEHPSIAKRLGRKVRGFDERAWVEARYQFVVEGNLAKFSQSPVLSEYLLTTAPQVLVEASPSDRIWGIGLAASNPTAGSPSAWRGKNLLGFALVEVRERLSAR